MDNKLKILCIHGYRQNKDKFKQKLGAFRKLLSAYAEFFFVNAPHIVEPSSFENAEEERSWWFTGENSYDSNVASENVYGFEESVLYLQQVWYEHGPFDGILGFSQGAAMAAIICSLCETREFNGYFRFAILVAGYMSLCPAHADYYETEVNIPALHIAGDEDKVIVKERSEKLAGMFEISDILSHMGGHYVPATKEFKQIYYTFISRYF